MKRFLCHALVFGVSVSAVYATEVEVHSRVESVIIYHSGALVTRTASNQLRPGVHELMFKNLSSKLILNSLKVSNKEVTILNRSIIRKLTVEEYHQLLDQRDALTKQMTLIEAKYNEQGFISKIEDLERMTAFYLSKILEFKRDLRGIQKKIDDAKKLEGIQLENENAAILKLVVSVEGALNAPLKLQYVCGGIGWSPGYEILVEHSNMKSIELKYLAKTMSQTGEDWDQVSISFSSSFPLESPNTLPKPPTLWTLRSGAYDRSAPVIHQSAGHQIPDQAEIQELEGVEYQEISIPSNLKLRTLADRFSIKSNSTVFTFLLETVTLPSEFYYFGFPSIDPEVYLAARVTGWDTLGFVDGIAHISFGGNDVGKCVIRFSESADTLLLAIARDNSIFLRRSEMAEHRFFRISTIGKRQITTLGYRFELKNNNSFPIQFELADQIPISQVKSAEVELEKTSGGQINDALGEVRWKVELKPGESTAKELIFTIELGSDYKSFRAPAKRFRTVRAPSF